MDEKQLVKVETAAKLLKLKRSTFLRRGYVPDKIIDGVRFFDIERLKSEPFMDMRLKSNKVVDYKE